MLGRLLRLLLRVLLLWVLGSFVISGLVLAAIAWLERRGRREAAAGETGPALQPAASAVMPPPEVDARLLGLLACPACKADVTREGDRIVCASCGRRYPIRDGVPIMLVEAAELPTA
jgi:uncharacterized protein YbaR (Trm112 family)